MLEEIKNIDKKLINKFLLLGFIILTVFVKFYKIDARSFSFDELYSVVGALEPNYNDFLENFIQNEWKSNNKIFILSHAGEFEKKIGKIELEEDFILQEKDFYTHRAYCLTK